LQVGFGNLESPRNSRLRRVKWLPTRNAPAAVHEFAGSGRQCARQEVVERALACAVGADETDQLVGTHRETDVADRTQRAETAADAAHIQKDAHDRPSPRDPSTRPTAAAR